eukprot:comp22092_c0_seq1/m.51276 comp22092_c0_seq1/g.51276  ORF comp22092_c0_seq1/g.51276 comp22092_c0_seq1/m.51276 type:complete len:348 (-) comp22092_c0_seq1:415-1458(-)
MKPAGNSDRKQKYCTAKRAWICSSHGISLSRGACRRMITSSRCLVSFVGILRFSDCGPELSGAGSAALASGAKMVFAVSTSRQTIVSLLTNGTELMVSGGKLWAFSTASSILSCSSRALISLNGTSKVKICNNLCESRNSMRWSRSRWPSGKNLQKSSRMPSSTPALTNSVPHSFSTAISTSAASDAALSVSISGSKFLSIHEIGSAPAAITAASICTNCLPASGASISRSGSTASDAVKPDWSPPPRFSVVSTPALYRCTSRLLISRVSFSLPSRALFTAIVTNSPWNAGAFRALTHWVASLRSTMSRYSSIMLLLVLSRFCAGALSSALEPRRSRLRVSVLTGMS